MNTENSLILHGPVAYSRGPDELITFEDAYAVCVNGVSEGVFESLPEEYRGLPVEDVRGKLIIPGLVDLHIHAPQYQFRGIGMDMELLPWLASYAFPEEARYADIDYAAAAYAMFVKELRHSATTRACVFATAHKAATLKLMELLEESGLVTFVGKVCMDRNVPDYYVESTEGSLSATGEWLSEAEKAGFLNTHPIITPRFTPACTRELMRGLAELSREYAVPVQSHLSENLSEIELVKELEPDTSCYADSYVRAGLIRKDCPSVMVHCVWSGEEELSILKENGVFIAHSPESNINLCSGAAPVKKYLEAGLNTGLATDVAGGSSTSMFSAIRNAVFASKLRFRLYDGSVKPLTFSEAFYLATKGGGAFFGKAGSLEKGYMFDALILDESRIPTMRTDMNIAERLERFVYLGHDNDIAGKLVCGKKLFWK
ncbi:MAG TPA: guanine deaminase [Lachnospiraceae bacterium]|nr:guanine deaminase [Lachnospiraceae bacterium]